MSYAIGREMLLWLVRILGQVVLTWSVGQLLEWLDRQVTPAPESEEESYVWDERGCDPLSVD